MAREMILTPREQFIYKEGLKRGIGRFAWRKDGIEYVGTSMITLAEAKLEIDNGPTPIAIRFDDGVGDIEHTSGEWRQE